MSKLILHVGTDTTTIQDTFALNRRFLAEPGLTFRDALTPANWMSLSCRLVGRI
ncbi:hypothetical protein [Paracoccus benzoatiresistens]|uniref:Uncharacterized protein n=1 Tax=Paracoccus benzoatiresistens TaxID=2997341 RepID=A0ABT4J6Z1_9RHOB|nr:hypothetical protein [Paracoccus sp. EF6]MCZ0962435.1 hypothetical protein [Paracoccus sp. EF6]